MVKIGVVATQSRPGPSIEGETGCPRGAASRRVKVGSLPGAVFMGIRTIVRRYSGHSERGHGEEAQAVLELLIIVPVLMYFFLGTIDFCRFMYYAGAVQSAARVGAETASNHCPYAGVPCGQSGTAVSDNFVIWATYCEASTAVNLNLGQYPIGQPNTTPSGTQAYQSTTISPCVADDTSKTWVPSCNNGSSCANCVNDICVAPSVRSSSTELSVSVGYDFRPITPLMDQFFSNQQCWQTTDSPAPPASDPTSNAHTLCARAVGGVY